MPRIKKAVTWRKATKGHDYEKNHFASDFLSGPCRRRGRIIHRKQNRPRRSREEPRVASNASHCHAIITLERKKAGRMDGAIFSSPSMLSEQPESGYTFSWWRGQKSGNPLKNKRYVYSNSYSFDFSVHPFRFPPHPKGKMNSAK